MRSVLGIVSIVIVSLILAACGSSGNRDRGGSQCKKDYDPFPLKHENTKAKKVAFDAKKGEIPEGFYSYKTGDLFFNNTKTDQMVHIRELARTNEKNIEARVCVRNMKSGEQFSVDALGVSAFEIQPGPKVLFEQRNFSFEYNINVLKPTFKSDNKDKPDAPEKVYIKANWDYQLFKISDKEYELRSTYVDDGKEYHMSIVYTYSKEKSKAEKDDSGENPDEKDQGSTDQDAGEI